MARTDGRGDSRHAIPLHAAGRPARARSCFTLPAGGRARPERGDRSRAYQWRDGGWRGRPWEETVIYELHVGDVHARGHVPRGHRQARPSRRARRHRDRADAGRRFPGPAQLGLRRRATCSRRMRPTAGRRTSRRWSMPRMQRGLMVFLDVVYNHFGPEGNYSHAYAPSSSPTGTRRLGARRSIRRRRTAAPCATS